ncbi:MAG: tetratricopeptide repeat protein, partial [Acidimicrobiia bacterium]|nr:tetratricopeptide repeat protein [Acidimicrobiia bacterium]
ATDILLEVVDGAEHLGLRSELWEARLHLGLAAMFDDDPERAQAAYEEIYQWASEDGEFGFVADCCIQLAYLALIRHEFETARSLVSESMAAAERLGSPRDIAHCLETQGWVELAAGRLDEARRAFEDALRVESRLGWTLDLPVRLGLAAVECAAGDLSAAVRHTQDALSHLEEAQQFYSSHVNYLLQIAACIHSASGNLDRAAALKALMGPPNVWSRRGPMSGWMAAIDQTDGALTIQYPTRVGLLPEILALNEVDESH